MSPLLRYVRKFEESPMAPCLISRDSGILKTTHRHRTKRREKAMLTETRRPLNEKELAQCRAELQKAELTFGAAEKAAALDAKVLTVVRVACPVFAILAVVGYRIVSAGLLTMGVVLFIITLYFTVMSFAPKPNYPLNRAKHERDELRELIDRGVFVETRVTSSRCFLVDAFDDESSEYFFDLGHQGTLIICAFEMDSHWTPNTDFRFSWFETPTGTRFHDQVRGVGQRLEPVEAISRSNLTEPDYEHLAVVPGAFEDRLKEMRKKAEA